LHLAGLEPLLPNAAQTDFNISFTFAKSSAKRRKPSAEAKPLGGLTFPTLTYFPAFV
jgi:hypothetical protein